MFSSDSTKAKLFKKAFLRTSILMTHSGISLYGFPSRTNLKLHNIHVYPKLVKKVTINLHLSKVLGLDRIPVVDLKKCEPELSYILAEPFKMCLKESCFSNCWKIISVILIFKIVGKGSISKN